MTVLLWRGRFERDRLAGLRDAQRPGRAPTYTRADRDRVIALTLEPPPDGTTYWSARRIALRVGMSITTVQRIWAEADLKPHRVEKNEGSLRNHSPGGLAHVARRIGPVAPEARCARP